MMKTSSYLKKFNDMNFLYHAQCVSALLSILLALINVS
jgi:hypothetical protein